MSDSKQDKRAPEVEREQHSVLACCSAAIKHGKTQAAGELGAQLTSQIYRLVKNMRVHDIQNEAVRVSLSGTQEILRKLGAVCGDTISLTFLGELILVNGDLLRTSREQFEQAAEIGQWIRLGNASELIFDSQVSIRSIELLGSSITELTRGTTGGLDLSQLKVEGIQIRASNQLVDQSQRERPAEHDRTVRSYAEAVLVTRELYQRAAAGQTMLMHRLKRSCQRIVTLAERDRDALFPMLLVQDPDIDLAARAVKGAFMAVMLGAEFEKNRVVLRSLATSALLSELGRVSLTRNCSTGQDVSLEKINLVPTETGACCLTAGGINLTNALRTTATFEANWLGHGEQLGPVYRGALPASMNAHILHLARAFVEMMTPGKGKPAVPPIVALVQVARMNNFDPTLMRCLTRRIGVIPAGTVVELDDGSWAIVRGPSGIGSQPERPAVHLLTNAAGAAFPRPRAQDLGEQGQPSIRSVVAPAHLGFNSAAALIQETGARPGQRPPAD